MRTCKSLRLLVSCIMLTASSMVFAQDLPRFIIPVNPTKDVPPLSDAEVLERALPIRFEINRSSISKDEPNYRLLISELKRLQSEGYAPGCGLILRGSASPDGSYENNRIVAARRVSVLADSLARHITLPEKIDDRNAAEDYEMLRSMITSSDYKYKDEVIDILDTNASKPAAIKSALRALHGGIVWKDLYGDFFPEMRVAHVVLYMEVPVKEEDPVIVPEPQTAEPEQVEDVPVMEEPADEEIPAITETVNEAVKKIQPMFNIKTNVLYDLAVTPNISVEFLPRGGHITAAAEWMWANWRSDSKFKTWVIQNILLEGRWYLKGGASYTGHYFGVYANAGKYDIQFASDRAWLSPDFGKTFGAGLGWGYVGRIGRSNWKWEVNAALGYLHSPYDRYHSPEEWGQQDKWYYDFHGDPTQFRAQSHKLNYFGLTRLGVTISYDIPCFGWRF